VRSPPPKRSVLRGGNGQSCPADASTFMCAGPPQLDGCPNRQGNARPCPREVEPWCASHLQRFRGAALRHPRRIRPRACTATPSRRHPSSSRDSTTVAPCPGRSHRLIYSATSELARRPRALAATPLRQMRGQRPEIPGRRHAGPPLATPTSGPVQEHDRGAAQRQTEASPKAPAEARRAAPASLPS
jgi:hypothetical protein